MKYINRKSYRRFLIVLLLAHIVYTGIFFINNIYNKIPDSINILVNDKSKLDIDVPLNITVDNQSVEAGLQDVKTINNNLTVTKKDNLIFESDTVGSYKVKFKLFGLVNVKTVDVNVVEPQSVIPAGIPIGLYLQTDGVMVIGTGKVTDSSGIVMEPAYGIVNSGDYIVSLNNITVSSKSQLTFLINKYGKEDIILGIKRNNEVISVKIKSIRTSADEYKLGIWVRDDTQGIGTLTYIDANGKFGALGHGISDVDTGRLLNSMEGLLYKANIWGIKKGEAGNPGGLCGTINYEDENILGKIYLNSGQGIFGTANNELIAACGNEALPIGFKQEIETGTAYIRCQVGEGLTDYKINIEEVNISSNDLNRGMEITITDNRLLSLTNGIVQGMSGSPIIQNGKIIGAVTHVFVKDSTKGYGIFIENMLSTANQ